MQFTPESEEDIDKAMLLAAGTYDFEVIDAKDAVSKKGNEMIALTLRVFSPDDSTRVLSDWLLPEPALAKKKLARFCRAVGLEAKYELGLVTAADCDGRSGKVVIKHQDDDKYGLQARVDTYEPRSGAGREATPPGPPVLKDEDIPF